MFPRRIKAILYMPLFPIQICKICFECHFGTHSFRMGWGFIPLELGLEDTYAIMQLCDVVGIFGDNGICNEQNVSLCDCLEGFNQRIQKVGTYPSTLVGAREETFFNAQMTTSS